MKTLLLQLILVLSTGLSSTVSNAQGLTPWPDEVLNYFQHAVPNAIGNLGAQGFNGLYTAIGDLSIFSYNTGPHSFGVTSHRDIWDNHDIFNTWTVVDQMTFKYNASIQGPSAMIGPALPGVSLVFGVGGALHYLNVRRSDSKHYPTISPIEVRENETKDLLSDPEIKNWYDLDPLRRAQFYQMGKRFAIPFRIPMTHEGLSKIDSGEIISYDVSGTVSLGGNIGWTIPSLSSVPALSLGATLTTYRRGGFRYTIQKINPESARIKVTTETARGRSASYGAAFDPLGIFQGFTVFGVSGIAGQSFNITPFQFQVTREIEKTFDVSYEYDLQQESAQAAYDRATLGDMAYSERLADEYADRSNAPVKKAFTQDAHNEKRTKGSQVVLGFLYKKQDARNITRVDSEITLPDGIHHLFRAISDNWNQWTSIIGNDEKIRFQFSFFSNLERYQKNLDDSLSLLAEGFVDDAVTSGTEMRRYSNRFEVLAGVKKEVFPRLPLYPPEIKDEKCKGWNGWKSFSCIIRKVRPKSLPAYYGRSSFYVKLGFNRPMIQKFIDTPEEEMWPILESAFGVSAGDWEDSESRSHYFFDHFANRLFNAPLYFGNRHHDHGPNLDVAKKFYRTWVELHEEKDVKEQIKMLSRIFSTVYYGGELMKVLRLSMKEIPVPYTLSGQNKLFSRQIREEDWGITVNDYLSMMTQREIDIENYHSTVNLDEKAKITDLSLSVAKVEEREDSDELKLSVKTRLSFSIKPKFIFYKIMMKNRWSFTKNVSEAMMANIERFKVGPNEILITNDGTQDLGRDLFKPLRADRKYLLIVSVSQDGKTWGPIAQTELKLDLVQPTHHPRKNHSVKSQVKAPTEASDEVLLEGDDADDENDSDSED